MNTEITGDPTFTESALTPPPATQGWRLTRLIRIFVVKVHSCGCCRGVRSVGELPSRDGVGKTLGWRGEADVRVLVRQCTRPRCRGESWPEQTTKPGGDVD